MVHGLRGVRSIPHLLLLNCMLVNHIISIRWYICLPVKFFKTSVSNAVSFDLCFKSFPRRSLRNLCTSLVSKRLLTSRAAVKT